MKPRTKAIAGASALCLIATFTVGCEDSGITAPAGSTITVIASPASVSINQIAGETSGSTTILAQLLGEGGQPLQNVPLVFTTTGGLLGSVDNVCLSNQTCSRSVDACLLDSDCPFVDPVAIETDATGLASDILTLRLIQDPAVVDVTVQSTSSSTTISVAQNVNTGPIDPVANIVAIPPGGQRAGASFNFDGTGSTFDPLVDLTCYQWTITSSMPANSTVIRGPNESIITRTFGDHLGDRTADQDLSVVLRISDVPNIPCDDLNAPPPGAFSPYSAVLTYSIRCDFTPPEVDAGGNQSGTLSSGGGQVSFTLAATGSDPEDNNLAYSWNCDNGVTVLGQAVTCTYDTTGVFNARVTATNECGLETQDSVAVTVNQ